MTLTDSDVIARLSPAQVVALTLYGEARGSSEALRTGIASVIATRAKAKRPSWGLSPRAVCLKPWQFSCWTPAGGAANYASVMEAARLLESGVLYEGRRALVACLALGRAVVDGTLADTVQGATHYYAPAAMVPKNRVPAWAVGLEPVAVIDGTRFFAGVK
jgi:hypothetical protein